MEHLSIQPFVDIPLAHDGRFRYCSIKRIRFLNEGDISKGWMIGNNK